MASDEYLLKSESVLMSELKSTYDINDIIEFYNIKKYIDNDMFLGKWNNNDILSFKQRVLSYGKIIGKFMSNINDSNLFYYFDQLLFEYIEPFFELVENQKIFKHISSGSITKILSNEPFVIHTILHHRLMVSYYSEPLKSFLLTYPESAQILLSKYELQKEYNFQEIYLPNNLSILEKENIVSNYLDSDIINLNYINLILSTRNQINFKISDKTRLKAKRRYKAETNKLFLEQKNDASNTYEVSVVFSEKTQFVKNKQLNNKLIEFSYNLKFIKKNSDLYFLYLNFYILFEFLDNQYRINLVSKESYIGVLERTLGLHSQNAYRRGLYFKSLELSSYSQTVIYYKVLIDELKISLEEVLVYVYTSILSKKYKFASNARLLMPSANNSFLERVRLLAPEFESVLKQFKLYVEEGFIDFELLQISSSPCAIKDIPSLVHNKYIYFNSENIRIKNFTRLLFSDQTLLSYVDPYKEKRYRNLYDLLSNEQVNIDCYKNYLKPQIYYLVENDILVINDDGLMLWKNIERVSILKDLYKNEVASYHHYSFSYQLEVDKMLTEDMIYFESSLFTRPEQSYFNYNLNRSEFTNGLDLRNSYLHGTQANHEDTQKHEHSYFTYLKLLVLVIFKIEDDLAVYLRVNKGTELET
ncbi:hypothetical protein [Fibrivirga algicola]|uniref:DUF4209 domain-containing protein n=1 Tax=Fibrivirga algicola TaxID=2950420 RepID=A0ABX0QFS5_9BACT|nr:hypothetical protein [Fibrivirga algicola]NID08924.1 hypothetical protein [Fibrivirga algicola]